MIRIRKSFLVLLLLAFGYALFSGGNLPYSIFYALLLMVFFMGTSTYFLGKKMSVKVEAEKYEMISGENNNLVIKVYNNSIFPVPYVEIKSSLVAKILPRDRGDIISLGVNAQKFIKKAFVINTRGQYYLGEISSSISDVLGVFSYKKNFKYKKIIKVYPKIYDLNSVRIVGANLREFNTNNIRAYNKGPESAETIKNIREYRRGDSYKRINWKVTAKHGKLFVKEYDSSESPRIHVFLDLRKSGFVLDKDGENEEAIVEFYLSLVRYIIQRNGNCQSIIINNTVKASDIVGESSLELLKEQMVTTFSSGSGNLSGYMKKFLCEINKKSAVVVVTSNITRDNLDYLVSLKQEGYEINLFYLNKFIGDGEELIEEVKGQGVSCYNIEGVR